MLICLCIHTCVQYTGQFFSFLNGGSKGGKTERKRMIESLCNLLSYKQGIKVWELQV